MFPVKEEQMKDKGRHREKRILPMNRVLMLLTLTLLFVGSAYAADLNYWIEPDASGNPSKVWVKVPYIPANGTATIYVRKEAGYSPNGEAVFDLFCDFETDTCGLTGFSFGNYTTGHGWTRVYVGGTHGYVLRNTDSTTDTYSPAYFPVEINYSFVYDAWYMAPSGQSSDIWGGFCLYNPSKGFYHITPDTYYVNSTNPGREDIRTYDAAGNLVDGPYTYDYGLPLDFWRHIRMIWDWTGTEWNLTVYIDDEPQATTTFANLWSQITFRNLFPTYVGVISAYYTTTYRYWDNIKVYKHAPQDPTITVTDKGDYYEITISNPNSTDLTDFQISIPAADLNVTSTTESLHFSDQPFSGISVSLSHSPTAAEDLALDPENNVTEVNVTYRYSIDTYGVEITEVHTPDKNYLAGDDIQYRYGGSPTFTGDGLVCHGYPDYVLTSSIAYPSDENMSLYVDFTISPDMNVDTSKYATVFADKYSEYGVRIHYGYVEVIATPLYAGYYKVKAVPGRRYRFLLVNGPDGFKVYEINDDGYFLVFARDMPGTYFANEVTILCANSDNDPDATRYFAGTVHQITLWNFPLSESDVNNFVHMMDYPTPTWHSHLIYAYQDGDTYKIKQAAPYSVASTHVYESIGDYNTCVYVKGVDSSGREYNGVACDVVHIDQYPQGVNFDWAPKIPFTNEEINFVGQATDNGELTWEWNFQGVTDVSVYTATTALQEGDSQTVEDTFWKDGYTLILDPQEVKVYISTGGSIVTFTVTLDVYASNDNVTYTLCQSASKTVTSSSTFVGLSLDQMCIGRFIRFKISVNTTSARVERWINVGDINYTTTADGTPHVKALLRYVSYVVDGNTAKVFYEQSGTYPVTLTVTDDVGLSKSVSKTVSVFTHPTIHVTMKDTSYYAKIEPDSRLQVIRSEWNTTENNWVEPDGDLNVVVTNPPEGNVYYILYYDVLDANRELNDPIPYLDFNYTITAGFHPTTAEENITFFWDFDNNVSCSWAAGATTGEFNGSPEGEYNATWEHKEGGSLSVWAKCTDDKNNSMYHTVTKGILVYKIEPMDEETGVYDLNLWGDVQTGEAPLFRFIATDAEFNESYIYEDINETMWLVLDPTKKWFMRFEQHYTDQVIIDAFNLGYSPYDIPLCVSPDKPNILQTAFSSTPIDGKAFAITRAETGCLRTIQTTGYVKDGYGFTFYTQAGQYAVWLIDGPGKYEDKQLLAAFFGDTQTVLDLEKLLLLLRKAEEIELPPYHTLKVEELPDENASVIKFISNEVMEVFEMNIYHDGADEPFYTQRVYDVNSLSTTILWKQYNLNRDTVVRITYRGELPDGRVIKGSIRTTMSGRLIKYAWWQAFIILFVLAVMAFLRIKNPTQFLVFAGLYIVFAVVLIPVTELTVATQAMGILGAILAIIAIIIMTKFI